MRQLGYEQRAQELKELDETIRSGMDLLRKQADLLREQPDAVDAEQMNTLVGNAETAALTLNDRLPPYLDDGALAEIRGILIGALRKVREEDNRQPLDVLDDFLVRAESIRHILRDSLDDELPVDENDANAVLTQIVTWLPGVRKKEIPELIGVDPRTMQRWAKEGVRTPRRLFLVAKLANLLKDAWTPEGVVAWFRRPRHDLDGKTPLEVLDDPNYERSLIDAVREGRAQHGS